MPSPKRDIAIVVAAERFARASSLADMIARDLREARRQQREAAADLRALTTTAERNRA